MHSGTPQPGIGNTLAGRTISEAHRNDPKCALLANTTRGRTEWDGSMVVMAGEWLRADGFRGGKNVGQ